MYKLELNSRQPMELIDITSMIKQAVKNSGVNSGEILVYIPHTTAGLTVNENADPDVVRDLLLGLKALSPDRAEYAHGEGNSPAHLLSVLVGVEKHFIIEGGRLLLGTWQGIYFCEFDGPRSREVWIHIS